MASSPYKDLPIDTLHELFLLAVKDLLDAMDSATRDDDVSAKPKKRQVEQLYTAIILKQGMEKEHGFSKRS